MKNQELIEKAIEAKKNAYVPYSNFHVGAAVLTDDNTIYTGCNIENAAYTPTVCAERTAIFKAVSAGKTHIKKIAIVGDADMTYPCGVCRQVIKEFGEDAEIIIANSKDDYKVYRLEDLLPHSFGPEDLKNAKKDSD